MRDTLRRLFPTSHYSDPVQIRRALGIYVAASLLMVAAVILLLTFILGFWAGLVVDQRNNSLIACLLIFIGASIAIVLTRQGQQTRGGWAVVATWTMVMALIVLGQVVDGPSYLAFSMLGISLAALLVGSGPLLPLIIVTEVVLIINNILTPSLTYGILSWLVLIFLYAPVLIIAGVINHLLAQSLGMVARQARASADLQRLRLAEASSKLSGQLLLTRLDLKILLTETIKLLKDLYPTISSVQIYLTDKDQNNATLTVSSDDTLPIGQQVGIGSLTLIGRVTISGQPIVVRANSENPTYGRSNFVQGARAQIVLPLRVGAEIIGALDIQSQDTTAFTPDDVKLLETMANQIAVAVDNTRLYGESQSQLAENKRLYEQTRNSLREIERLNQQLTGTAWTEYMLSLPAAPAYTLDLASGRIESAAEWTPTLAEASRRNQVVVQTVGQSKFVSLPISVRGQPIGAMEFEIPPDQQVSNEQMTILQQVVERLGLATENARLLEDAQRRAQREAMVNEISTRMQTTTNVEEVIKAATQSLGAAIRADRIAIRLGTPGSGPAAAGNKVPRLKNNGNGSAN